MDPLPFGVFAAMARMFCSPDLVTFTTGGERMFMVWVLNLVCGTCTGIGWMPCPSRPAPPKIGVHEGSYAVLENIATRESL